MIDSDLLTLAEAAKLIPGADADTLKRLARRGKLVTYRPGKASLTTRADVLKAIQSCRVTPKARDYGFVQAVPIVPPLGSSSTDHASAALDSALALVAQKKKRH